VVYENFSFKIGFEQAFEDPFEFFCPFDDPLACHVQLSKCQ
jgi:hypothetical protein